MSDFVEDKSLSFFSGITSPKMTIDDIYELVYRIAGGILLYIAVFHDSLNFSKDSIFSLFLTNFFSNTLFGNIFLIFFLLVMSLIATYFFGFVNYVNSFLFHFENQFKKGSFLQKTILWVRKGLFPFKIVKDEDDLDVNFKKGLLYLFALSKADNIDLSKIGKPISSRDFFEVINYYVQNKIADSSGRRSAGLIVLTKCMFISVVILNFRFLIAGNYVISFLLLCFAFIIWNSIKNIVEGDRYNVLIKFYSSAFFGVNKFN